MPGISKLSRFDQSKLQDIYQTGSVNYTIGDFNLFSVDVDTTDPTEALVSIPLSMEVYSETDAKKLYDFKFKTFVDAENVVTASIPTQEINTELQATLDQLRSENVLSEAERKSLIVTLRIQLGQGTSTSDFHSTFPYDPINVVLPEDITEPFIPDGL